MEISVIVAIISVIIAAISVSAAIYFGVHSKKRNDKEDLKMDVESEATTNAIVMMKLETIQNTLQEIKAENSHVREDIRELFKQVAVIENSVKSAHHRIDEFTGKAR